MAIISPFFLQPRFVQIYPSFEKRVVGLIKSICFQFFIGNSTFSNRSTQMFETGDRPQNRKKKREEKRREGLKVDRADVA